MESYLYDRASSHDLKLRRPGVTQPVHWQTFVYSNKISLMARNGLFFYLTPQISRIPKSFHSIVARIAVITSTGKSVFYELRK